MSGCRYSGRSPKGGAIHEPGTDDGGRLLRNCHRMDKRWPVASRFGAGDGHGSSPIGTRHLISCRRSVATRRQGERQPLLVVAKMVQCPLTAFPHRLGQFPIPRSCFAACQSSGRCMLLRRSRLCLPRSVSYIPAGCLRSSRRDRFRYRVPEVRIPIGWMDDGGRMSPARSRSVRR